MMYGTRSDHNPTKPQLAGSRYDRLGSGASADRLLHRSSGVHNERTTPRVELRNPQPVIAFMP